MTEQLRALEQERANLLLQLRDNQILIDAEKSKTGINWACPCHNDEAKSTDSYSVNLFDRLKDQFFDDEVLTDNTIFSYEWNRGYERINHHRLGEGSSEYAGSYHPNGVCETGNESHEGVCLWCGSTLF